MVPLPVGVRVRLATGYTDMRKKFPSLACRSGDLHCDAFQRPPVLLPRSSWQFAERNPARRPGRLPVHEAPAACPLHLAESSRRCGYDLRLRGSAISDPALIAGIRRRRGGRHHSGKSLLAVGDECDSIAGVTALNRSHRSGRRPCDDPRRSAARVQAEAVAPSAQTSAALPPNRLLRASPHQGNNSPVDKACSREIAGTCRAAPAIAPGNDPALLFQHLAASRPGPDRLKSRHRHGCTLN
jgi:hypothetical protein